jgi:hypothetical protein
LDDKLQVILIYRKNNILNPFVLHEEQDVNTDLMKRMEKKIISEKRVDEVIFGFADYADVYYEKDDQKIYDDDDEEPYMEFFEEHYEECVELLVEDKIITRAQGNYLMKVEHDDLGWNIREEATREYMIMLNMNLRAIS